ncbi:alpha/beta fold hydrolase [Bifidobacterium avesanii]|uniref:Alpha/beta fold hydrolase n=1 Tax=Bifidobacterium avesanii TaxID=1798157 RepID=A0A7K3TIK7_9BIFI|nr:alpha/beta hydrolase [Bifidobacterium avesanii]KAB8290115.1 lysophospholipase [Bifidobacterium avesanii]NEG78937.1 alpha/beta fold hydrolase [Bifidobacterium avesanii]
MQITLIDENDYRHEMETKVLPALEACRDEGWFEPPEPKGLGPAPTSGRLHYVCYDAARFDAIKVAGADATFRGAIVISHGFTEFAAKYAEMVWYFLLAGYSVCVLEHRGHGRSVRDLDDKSLVWIDDWRRYVSDLAAFAGTIGQQYAGGSPLNLYAHSMGGGIGAAVLEQYPTLFDRAVLSAPMIAPATGMPNGVARVLAEGMCAFGLSRHVVFGQGPFDPNNLDMSEHRGASEARVRWFHHLRCEDEHRQTNAATFEWVRQALRLSHAVSRPEACANVETPILLFQADHDIWVLNQPQDRFASLVRDGGCEVELVRVPDSLHELFSMPNAVLGPYLDRILDFFDDPVTAAL